MDKEKEIVIEPDVLTETEEEKRKAFAEKFKEALSRAPIRSCGIFGSDDEDETDDTEEE